MDKYYNPGEKIKDYSIIKLIGKGRYGIVYLAEDSSHKRYIIKQLKENNELVLIDFGLARYMDNKRHVKYIDFWYLSDLERHFFKKLMGIEGKYKNINEIRNDLDTIKK